jgi:heme-degrading monooxygenase HmoA
VTGRFADGQVVTVFRSTLRDDPDDGYLALDAMLRERAASLGGLVDVTSFVAEDGERVTVVTFEDQASHDRWAHDDVHREAQRLGREAVYARYSIQVSTCTRATERELVVEGGSEPGRP